MCVQIPNSDLLLYTQSAEDSHLIDTDSNANKTSVLFWSAIVSDSGFLW